MFHKGPAEEAGELTAALCPSCGAVAKADPCPECGSPLRPPPGPAALALVAALWFVSVLGVPTGVAILRGGSPVLNRATGLLFFLPLALAAAVTLLWILRFRAEARPPGETGRE